MIQRMITVQKIELYIDNEEVAQLGVPHLADDSPRRNEINLYDDDGNLIPDKVVFWNENDIIPSNNMLYNGETFLNGPNGESFRSFNFPWPWEFECFIFLKNNTVVGFYILSSVTNNCELLSAVLKSDPELR